MDKPTPGLHKGVTIVPDDGLAWIVVAGKIVNLEFKSRLLGYEKVYLSLHKVADTPFHVHGDEV